LRFNVSPLLFPSLFSPSLLSPYQEILETELTRIRMNMSRFGQNMQDIMTSWEKLRGKVSGRGRKGREGKG
jgi:hypothetical protein